MGLGATILTEEGIGETISVVDEVYAKAGAVIIKDRTVALSKADIICRLNAPPIGDTSKLKKTLYTSAF